MRSRDRQPRGGQGTEPAEQAQAWFVTLLGETTAAQRVEFTQWLNADPAHMDAYRDVEASWQAMEGPGHRLAEREADELSVYLKAMDRNKRGRKTASKVGLLVLLGAVVLAGGLWLERPGLIDDLRADYATSRGERRTVTLDDGSTVLLDADSALSLELSPNRRRVHLLRGGAYFDVTPSSVPFVVDAADGSVSVLGTGFDVRLVDDGGSVTLAHGRVAVRAGGQPSETILEPGEQVRFGPNGVADVQTVAIEDALAWRGGRYAFYRARLADVVAEIERYRMGRILVVGSDLADARVTGSFALNDTDAALQSLQASVGFNLHSLGGRLTIVSP
ncbi:FecR family protein [Rhizobium sp. ZW T2_16]|uniref:FecR family protein n=1 Tax=Rhizobium sp. ZW T2_16 TaxID=3378083 RepID=UPI0038555160